MNRKSFGLSIVLTNLMKALLLSIGCKLCVEDWCIVFPFEF